MNTPILLESVTKWGFCFEVRIEGDCYNDSARTCMKMFYIKQWAIILINEVQFFGGEC